MTLFAHSFQLLTKDVVDATTTTTRYYYLSGASFHVLFEDFVERVKRRVRMVSLSERESEREREREREDLFVFLSDLGLKSS